MIKKVALSMVLITTTSLISAELPPAPPVTDAPGATTTSANSLSLKAGWNFISAPFNADMDIATLVSAGCSINVFDNTIAWFTPKTSGSSVVGQAVVANCTSATTASFSPTTNSTDFSMFTNISSAGKGNIPSTHAAYSLGSKYSVVGTPVSTTIGEVVTAGASNVLYYDGSNWNTGSTTSSTTTLPAGSSFYIQTQ